MALDLAADLKPINWLPKDHLAFFLLDLIDQLNLDPILQLYR